VFEEIFLLKMGNYPPNEIVDMIRIVGEAGNNYSAAAWLYSVKFPDRRHPNKKVMKRLSEHRSVLNIKAHSNAHERKRIQMKLWQWLLLLALC